MKKERDREWGGGESENVQICMTSLPFKQWICIKLTAHSFENIFAGIVMAFGKLDEEKKVKGRINRAGFDQGRLVLKESDS